MRTAILSILFSIIIIIIICLFVCLYLHRYLRCFYWALLTVSTIHELEENNPSTNLEFAVEMIGYLFGVFVLAVIIGEVGLKLSPIV